MAHSHWLGCNASGYSRNTRSGRGFHRPHQSRCPVCEVQDLCAVQDLCDDHDVVPSCLFTETAVKISQRAYLTDVPADVHARNTPYITHRLTSTTPRHLPCPVTTLQSPPESCPSLHGQRHRPQCLPARSRGWRQSMNGDAASEMRRGSWCGGTRVMGGGGGKCVVPSISHLSKRALPPPQSSPTPTNEKHPLARHVPRDESRISRAGQRVECEWDWTRMRCREEECGWRRAVMR